MNYVITKFITDRLVKSSNTKKENLDFLNLLYMLHYFST